MNLKIIHIELRRNTLETYRVRNGSIVDIFFLNVLFLVKYYSVPKIL